MEVRNTTECYVYVFGKETDGTSYTLFPYPRTDYPEKTKYLPSAASPATVSSQRTRV